MDLDRLPLRSVPEFPSCGQCTWLFHFVHFPLQPKHLLGGWEGRRRLQDSDLHIMLGGTPAFSWGMGWLPWILIELFDMIAGVQAGEASSMVLISGRRSTMVAGEPPAREESSWSVHSNNHPRVFWESLYLLLSAAIDTLQGTDAGTWVPW